MAYTFSMTEQALNDGIKEIPATYTAFASLIQRLGVAGAEYAIVNRNGKYLQKIMEAMPDKYRTFFKAWACQVNVALSWKKEDERIAFNGKKGVAILKARGVEWKRSEPDKFTPEDETMLEKLATFAAGVLSAVQWDSQLKKEQKEARKTKAKETTADDLKKSLDRLKKKAEKAGVSLRELGLEPETVAVAEELPEDIQKIVDMLLPVSSNKNAIVAVTLAIAGALKTSAKAA